MASPTTKVAGDFYGTASKTGTYDFVSTQEKGINISRQETMQDILTYTAPAAVAAMADTFGTSLGLLDDGDVESYLMTNYKTFGDYYARNKEAVSVIGDLTGMFIPGLGGMKAIQGGGVVAKSIAKFTGKESKLLNSVFTSGKSYDQILDGVRDKDLFLAVGDGLRGGGTRVIGEDLMRKSLARKAMTTRLTDTVKENLAFELGVAATMNNSDVLFPDEYDLIDHIALAAALPTVFGGAELLFMRRQLRQSALDVGKLANEALNKEGVPLKDIIFREGKRSEGLMLYSVAADSAQMEFDAAVRQVDATGIADDVKLKNFNAEIQQFRTEMKEQIIKLGTDKPIKDLTNRVNLSDKQVNAAMNAQKADPTSLLGTISMENLGEDSVTNIKKLIDTRQELIGKLDAELETLHETTAKKGGKLDVNKIRNIEDKILKLEGLEFFVLEADGTVTVARGRKELFQDGSRNITKVRPTENEPAYYSTKVGKETFAVSEDGIAVIPPVGVEDNVVGGVNVTRIIKAHEEDTAVEKQSKILYDLATVYHPEYGQLGIPIFKSLSPELQLEIKRWTGNSGSSKIREWVAKNDPKYQELNAAMEPVRARLREIADGNGTITLYRGENVAETDWIEKFRKGDPNANSGLINDVVSMTSNVPTASAFGSSGNLIAKQVHVDDVVMIVGGLGNEFEFIVKGNRNRTMGDVVSKRGFRALDLKKRTALYDAFQAAAENYKPKGPGTLILTENDHHTRLDYALKLLRTPDDRAKGWNANAVASSIKLPKGVNSIEDLEFLSLSKKFDEVKMIMEMQNKANDPKSTFTLADGVDFEYNTISKMVNLPGTPTGDVHPAFSVMHQIIRMQGDTTLANAVRSVDHFHQMMQEHAFFPDVTAYRSPQLNLTGNMMDIPRDAAPSLLVKNPMKSADYQRDAIFNVVRDNRTYVMQLLSNADKDGGNFIKGLFDEIDGLSASQVAKDVDTLVEGQQRGSDLFLQPQFAAGENAAMQAMHLVANVTDRRSLEMRHAITEPHLNKFAAVRSKEVHINEFNMFVHARRHGWELEQAELVDGKYLFPLKKNKANRDRYESIFGEPMPENEKTYMPGQTRDDGNKGPKVYKPLGVNETVFAGIDAVAQIYKEVYNNVNVLRRAVGRSPLNFKEYYIPPKNFAKETSAFLVTTDGRMHSVQHGRTLADAKAKAQREIDNSDSTLFLVDRTDMSKYFSLEDEAFERMLDFSDPLNQTGRAKGTSVGDVVEIGDGVIDDITQSINTQFESLTRRTRALYFEPQVNYARHIYNTISSEKRIKGQTPWQHYVASIYGNPTINPNDAVGKTYFTAESLYDDLLNKIYDAKRALMGVGNKPTEATREQKRQFAALDKDLGEMHNPFDDALDYAQRTYNVSTPPNMKEHMAQLNRYTSFVTLQMGEVGHAVLNMTSLAANMPAVIKSLNRQAGETLEQWQARTAAFGTVLNESGTAQFNPFRASAYGMHLMWSAEGKPIRDEAAKLGFFNQDVAEIVKTMVEPGQNYHQKLISKSAEIAGYISNKSEEISRGISFMVGYGIAKRGLGIEGQKDAFAFAHNFANQVIGDYRANNRPRIFQGAVGMPLGLFMTFTQNYFQRIFSYIENKQVGTLVTQYAAQAAVFGGQTVPGFQQFNDFFVENYDGSVNLPDALQERFGTTIADTMLYGALGNLPKLFGSEDGFAIHTRGDANIQRIPGVWNIGNTPGVQMIKNGYGLLDKTLSMLQSNNGYNNQQMLEIASNYSSNRMLRNAFTLMAGYATDRRGNVINSDVYADVSIASRAMGLRPLKEAKETEVNARIRAGQLSQQAKMAELRHAFKAGIRSGDMDEEQFGELIHKYLEYGGNPRSIPRFLAEQHKKALVDRSTLELMKAMSDPSRMTDVKRLLSSQVLPQNDPYFQ